ALANRFLLHAEIRSGGTWYELVHDRFVDPILQANKAWWDKQDPLLRAARAWQDADRDKDKLYLGAQLREALTGLTAQPEPLVTAFMHDCQEEEERQRAQEQLRQRAEESNQKLLAEQQLRLREQTAAAAKMRKRL